MPLKRLNMNPNNPIQLEWQDLHKAETQSRERSISERTVDFFFP